MYIISSNIARVCRLKNEHKNETQCIEIVHITL